MHHLLTGAGWDHAGVRGLRAVLEAQEHGDLRAERAAVKLDRLLAAAVEKQVGLDVHGVSSSGFGVIAAKRVTAEQAGTAIIVTGGSRERVERDPTVAHYRRIRHRAMTIRTTSPADSSPS
jgi:hypothetical protein